jgi:hypothetical protein
MRQYCGADEPELNGKPAIALQLSMTYAVLHLPRGDPMG